MAKTVLLKYNVHLSEKFGGIKHGEKVGTDLKKGSTVKLESDELADHLVETGNAQEVVVEAAPEKKEKPEKKAEKKSEKEPDKQ